MVMNRAIGIAFLYWIATHTHVRMCVCARARPRCAAFACLPCPSATTHFIRPLASRLALADASYAACEGWASAHSSTRRLRRLLLRLCPLVLPTPVTPPPPLPSAPSAAAQLWTHARLMVPIYIARTSIMNSIYPLQVR